jgi:hypothetical protein
MKKTCVLFLLALLPLTVCAADAVEIDGVWYNLDAEQGCATVASATTRPGYVGDVVIPETVSYDGETYEVTAIAANAFAYSTLTSVSIGDGVTFIGDFAFYSCHNLADVAIGNGATTIGTSAFHWCDALKTIIIGSSIASIGESAFCDCSSLEDLYCLPEDLPMTESTSLDSRYLKQMTLHVSETAIDTYLYASPWGGFGKFVKIRDDELIKCATPEIGFSGDKVVFSCKTEGVAYKSEVQVADAKSYDTSVLSAPSSFVVSVFAVKKGCYRSDIATREFTFSDAKPSAKLGDLNNDGKVDVADHVKLSEIIMNQ